MPFGVFAIVMPDRMPPKLAVYFLFLSFNLNDFFEPVSLPELKNGSAMLNIDWLGLGLNEYETLEGESE